MKLGQAMYEQQQAAGSADGGEAGADGEAGGEQPARKKSSTPNSPKSTKTRTRADDRARLLFGGPRRILCGVAGSIDGRAGLLRSAGRCSAARTTPRSRPPIAGSPRNIIPTATTAAPSRKRGSRRSAKPMTSSRTRRSAPPTTASARPRSRTAAAAIRSASRLQRLLRHFLDHLRRVHGPARRTPECGARRRPALRSRAELEEAFTGVEKTITVEAHGDVRGLRRPRLHQGRSLRQHLPDLRRHGQGPRAAGLLRRRARLPDLPRLGRGDHRSLRQLPRRGPRARASASCR